MYVRWHRYGDYSIRESNDSIRFDGREPVQKYKIITHKVSYLPDSLTSVITRIDIMSAMDEGSIQDLDGRFHITFSPELKEKIENICKEINLIIEQERIPHLITQVLPDERDARVCTVSFPLLGNDDFDKLIEFMDRYNNITTTDKKPFSLELINELVAIQKIKTSIAAQNFRHVIELKYSFAIVTREDKFLIHLFERIPFSTEHREFLSKNYNRYSPRNEVLRLALQQAILWQPYQAVALLLWYNVAALSRGKDWRLGFFDFGNGSLSAFELAKLYKQNEKAALISRELAKPDRKQLKPPEVTTFSKYEDDSVKSVFIFPDKKIFTKLTLVSALTVETRQAIRTLFMKTFKSLKGQDDLDKEFEDEFCSHRLIDVIYLLNEVIGFVMVEIMKPEPVKFKKHLFVYGAYSAIAEEHQNLGIMQLLSFRVANSLKEMHPEFVIGVFYLAIHYNSYRLANLVPHWPKNQDEKSTALVGNLLELVMREGTICVHDNLLTYVNQSIIVKPKPKPKLNAESAPNTETEPNPNSKPKPIFLDEEMFNEEILGKKPNAPDVNTRRAPPIMFEISSESRTATEKHAESIGINYRSHITGYKEALAAFIRKHKVIIKKSVPREPYTYNMVELDKYINVTKPSY